MDRLEIMNNMLSAIGQMPVSSAESTHPFAIMSAQTLRSVDRETQGVGWWFNKDISLILSPNEDGFIILPANTLSVDSTNKSHKYVQRGGKLYDPETHSSVFTEAVTVDLTSWIDIESVPEQAANYIKRRASFEFFLDKDGEAKKLAELKDMSTLAWMLLRSEQMKHYDTNISQNPTYQALVGRFHNPEYRVGVR